VQGPGRGQDAGPERGVRRFRANDGHPQHRGPDGAPHVAPAAGPCRSQRAFEGGAEVAEPFVAQALQEGDAFEDRPVGPDPIGRLAGPQLLGLGGGEREPLAPPGQRVAEGGRGAMGRGLPVEVGQVLPGEAGGERASSRVGGAPGQPPADGVPVAVDAGRGVVDPFLAGPLDDERGAQDAHEPAGAVGARGHLRRAPVRHAQPDRAAGREAGGPRRLLGHLARRGRGRGHVRAQIGGRAGGTPAAPVGVVPGLQGVAPVGGRWGAGEVVDDQVGRVPGVGGRARRTLLLEQPVPPLGGRRPAVVVEEGGAQRLPAGVGQHDRSRCGRYGDADHLRGPHARQGLPKAAGDRRPPRGGVLLRHPGLRSVGGGEGGGRPGHDPAGCVRHGHPDVGGGQVDAGHERAGRGRRGHGRG
jgi:hypothetical protein